VNVRSPPRLATWLLERCGHPARSEGLIGDLCEQYAAGRTRVWLWYQVGGVLTLDLWHLVRMHALTFIGAVTTGCVLMTLWVQCISKVLGRYGVVRDDGLATSSPHAIAHFLTLRFSQIVTTVLVIFTAWTVTRIHRTYQRAVLVAFVIASVSPRIPSIADEISRNTASGTDWPVLLPSIVGPTLQALITIIAGLWGIRPERLSEMAPRLRAVLLLVITLAATNATLRDARLLGLISIDVVMRYVLVGLEISGAAYLAALLWRHCASYSRAA
jgi:hypothetical protein